VKTSPISFRPSRSLASRLDALHDRTGIPKGQLVEALADEAERARRYPGIAFRGPELKRRAWIIGSSLDAWEVVQVWQDLQEDSEAVRSQLGLTDRQISLALAYYREFSDEINQALGRSRRSLSELKIAYPFIEALEVEV